MPDNSAAQQLRKQFGLVYNRLSYYGFVEEILAVPVRDNDVWQTEKWENFLAASTALLRMPEDYLQRILDYKSKE